MKRKNKKLADIDPLFGLYVKYITPKQAYRLCVNSHTFCSVDTYPLNAHVLKDEIGHDHKYRYCYENQ